MDLQVLVRESGERFVVEINGGETVQDLRDKIREASGVVFFEMLVEGVVVEDSRNGEVAVDVLGLYSGCEVVVEFSKKKAAIDWLQHKGILQQPATVLWAAHEGESIIVERLIDAGVPFNNPNLLGTTPIFLAAKYGRVKVLKVLLAAGATMQPDLVSTAASHGHHQAAEFLQDYADKHPDHPMR
eukprot:TRINITY_DN26594_c0_g1_i1.p1 TRINITY_DN26594_c0_g1~~TRINITY_DN26594_c0_g1_i1.p1  ORF type:complete len:185 (+),score=40.46 TRINITY_DN26594_c0_g1_i1:52-606(+)